MRVTRRTVLKGAGAGSLAATLTPSARATEIPRLVVFDSRLPASRAFATENVGTGPHLDVAHEDAKFWRNLRSAGGHHVRIIGLTRWSDWVTVRGLLEEQGKRVRYETRMRGGLFRWTMH